MENKNALIIDDHVDICLLLETILKMSHIDAIHTCSLTETWDVLTSYLPSYIFIDHNLPDGLGFDHIQKLRAIAPEAVIIAMTARISTALINDIKNKGADFFLEKPFTILQVNKMVMGG
jgi:DNA-binding response OmpR family regulator